jgi:hypothetical protein
MPDVTELADATGECEVTVSAPTANDNCEGTITATTTDPTTYTEQGSYSITWIYDDGNGNTVSQQQTVIVDDTTAPVPDVAELADATGECEVTVSAPTASDNCEGTITATTTDPVSYTERGTYTITWTYDDGNGNTVSQQQTVIVDDTTAPVPNVAELADATGECEVTVSAPTASDNCEGTITATTTDPTTYTEQGSYTINWIYDDGNGNTVSQTQTVIVDDTTAPVVLAQDGNSTVNCLVDATEPENIPVATDNCMGTIQGVLESTVDTPNPINCEGTRVYTYSYTDNGNNVVYWTYTYTIDMPELKAIAPTSDLVSCYDDIQLPAAPVVTDACGNEITPAGPVESTVPGCEGDVTYTWTYTDCAGSTQNYVHTVTIDMPELEAIAPTSDLVSCYDDIQLPAAPVVTDACGNEITPAGPVESIVPGCEGDVTYTWTYTDCAGSTQNYVHTVTIDMPELEAIAPTSDVVSCYDDIQLPAAPVVTDACGNEITPAGPVESTVPGCEGDVTYTWTYTDCAGSTKNYVHTVTIEYQEFQVPENVTEVIECSSEFSTPVPPVVLDNCGTELTPSEPVIESAYDNCNGLRSYTFTYTDCAGNTKDWVFTYQIEDTTPPVIDCSPISINLRNNGIYILSQNDIRNLVGSVSDNCTSEENITISVSPRSFNCTHAGQAVPVTITATDECGNSSECQTTVTVNDNLAPQITCPEDITVSADSENCSAIVDFDVEITDNCNFTVNYSHESGSEFPIGITEVTVTATDDSGNSNTCSFHVTVVDDLPPTLICPGDIMVRLEEGESSAVVDFAAEASDNCEFTLKYSHEPGSEFQLGTTTVTATATDLTGNINECSFDVIVLDENAPVVVCPNDIDISQDEGQCGASVNFEASISDESDFTIVHSTLL